MEDYSLHIQNQDCLFMYINKAKSFASLQQEAYAIQYIGIFDIEAFPVVHGALLLAWCKSSSFLQSWLCLGNEGLGSGLEQNPVANDSDNFQFHPGVLTGVLGFVQDQERLLEGHFGPGQFVVADCECVGFRRGGRAAEKADLEVVEAILELGLNLHHPL